MKNTIKSRYEFCILGFQPGLLIAALIAVAGLLPARADNDVKIVPPTSIKDGKSYAEWSAAWWQWALSQPVEGHPFIDSPDFDVSGGQSGDVWFLGAPLGTVERTCTVPKNKALFIGLLNIEASSLEEAPFFGATEAEQRDIANYFSDHIVGVSCTIDGETVKRIERFRVASPQYGFFAPTPWIYGAAGGAGTSVADGYYLLLEPLGKGSHTIHYTGAFHFTLADDGFDLDLPLDMTYHILVQ